MTKPCVCKCGYRCGGPGICNDKECLTKTDGLHFVKECGHDFTGPMVEVNEYCTSSTCKKCGVTSISHDMHVGP